MKNPLVTICIATYNRSNLLPRAIESAQSQTYTNLEIIIVNDFSTDQTDEVIKEFNKKDERIKYLKHPGFIRLIYNRINLGDIEKITYKKGLANLPEGDISIKQALNFWDKIIGATHEECSKINRKDLITIKYEDMLLYPERTLKMINDFLGLKLDQKWLKKAIQIPRPFPEKSKLERLKANNI